ncbi:MAG: winged helix-turn-helix domain-containing protein [Acidimicrobiales bacterium]|jgi:two-component system response regulator TctD|nr:transcriptional regulator [Actinomycetes bacterium]MDP6105036.1 winged helix-turn-helix domain-containing protein [Acidimicrobiales bacterium]MDP7124817.1 winged helix-turn-helix domain-containing protein [Acidimicrobiales bacterium]MDP7352059.1 winged helix-turn-helix domain-containing protein [Acidimicrobiales bacterium]HJM30941.1 winged helix-turn-helix domain-containing protein [Acidimicrobiales bacterium]|tara:strand:+ start:2518 stop:3030 length:513 start_codon:yes stop_codon:yes gene_type:complete
MHPGDNGDIAMVRWPAEVDRLDRLRTAGTPRLVLVAPHAPPFTVTDALEDWVRMPADEGDVRARARCLIERCDNGVAHEPELADDRVLRFGRWWTTLTPVEARLAGLLSDRFGHVVPRADLARVGWPTGLPSRNSLDVQLGRLRRRIDGSGLVLRTVRSRGCMLAARPAA